MYEITTTAMFSAAHSLKNYRGSCEHMHGHNWTVQATVRCTHLDNSGMGIDFKILKKNLKDVLDALDHSNLDTLFENQLDRSPSSENIAAYVYAQMKTRINTDTQYIHKVEVWETPGNSAAYFEE
jgi:6-pyruvoyltetrahydropterin/6-carboxytetrahydropterin synthase